MKGRAHARIASPPIRLQAPPLLITGKIQQACPQTELSKWVVNPGLFLRALSRSPQRASRRVRLEKLKWAQWAPPSGSFGEVVGRPRRGGLARPARLRAACGRRDRLSDISGSFGESLYNGRR